MALPALAASLGLAAGGLGAVPTVPAGFTAERAAPAGAVRFPMFAAFDESGRLFVAESSGKDLYAGLQQQTRECRVSVLEDADGDGHLEQARVFADQLVFPMGLAWRDGRLYVADPPDLVALSDTDGDGRADRREVLLTGFGHQDNGSLHGLMFGPDGWLYLTMGQPDGYRLERGDGTIVEGRSGALLRCRPDGSDVQRLARGFENLVEIAFLPGGEMIGTDNWFFLPQDGVRDALVHLVPGGVYPLNAHARAEADLFFSGALLPPLSVYPAVAHSGLLRYTGQAFPAEMQGDLFSAQFNTRKVVRHRLSRHAGTFTSADADFVTTEDPDFHPSDVLEDAEGSLLVVDTGAWYVHHCPTGRIREAPAVGGLWRVRWREARPLPDPRGRKLEWAAAPAEELAARLGDARPVVRERALEALVEHPDAPEALTAVLNSPGPRPAKENAVWAAARVRERRLEGAAPSPERRRRLDSAVTRLLAAADLELAALAARSLAASGDSHFAPFLEPLLGHAAPSLRLAAAEALAECGARESVGPLVSALARQPEAFLEHALTRALHRCAAGDQLAEALGHPSAPVQAAALTLLDQPPHRRLQPQAVMTRLFAEDESLRRAAQAALRRHPEWQPLVGPALRGLLERPAPAAAEPATLREFLVSLDLTPDVVALIGRQAAAPDTARPVRMELLEVIARKPGDALPEAWRAAVVAALRDGDAEIQARGLRAVQVRRIAGLEAELTALARNAALPAGLRLEALRAGRRSQAPLNATDFDLLMAQLPATNAPALRLLAADVLGSAALDDTQLARFLAAARADRLLSPAAVLDRVAQRPLTPDAGRAVLDFLGAVVVGGGTPATALLEKLEGQAPPGLAGEFHSLRRQSAEAEARQRAELAALEPLLRGGDPNRGHELFLNRAGCAACHRVGRHGGLLGPDLTRIGVVRAGRDLIESLVMPSATFAQGYETFSVALRDGETLTGIQVRQLDGSFVLRDAAGVETRLEPGQVGKLERGATSLMPEGLLAALTREEMGDLFAYLQDLK